MAETENLGLLLLESNQAQKHITVNEALHRLDALVQARVESRLVTSPPPTATEGQNWLVPDNALAEWAGQGGRIAHRIGEGWDFLVPRPGWRLFVADEFQVLTFDGQAWQAGALSFTAGGSALSVHSRSLDVTLSGTSTLVASLIPDRAVVLGVTARVLVAITGTPTWRCGVTGSSGRYGTSIGTAQHSDLVGISSAPVGYYGPTDLLIEPETGSFTGGTVRLTTHFFQLHAPRVPA